MYDTINGKEQTISRNATNEAKAFMKELKRVRDEEKRKVLLKGLLPKIKEELWPRMPKDCDYTTLCDLAFVAESVVISKELTEDNEMSSVIAGITSNEERQNKENEKQKDDIERLRAQIAQLELTGNASTQVCNDNRRIAFLGHTGRGCESNKDIRGRQFRPSRFHHTNRSRTTSRDREYFPDRSRSPHPNRGHPSFRRRFDRVDNNATYRSPRRRSTDIICYNCKRKGHIRKECWEQQKMKTLRRYKQFLIPLPLLYFAFLFFLNK